ncbi:hypothetical protein BDZ97DRAFT_1922891 [Flammula alnicola]|nr:hypothetical protein BDZ97DRAFT_1922891 [Flammula alnicola]
MSVARESSLRLMARKMISEKVWEFELSRVNDKGREHEYYSSQMIMKFARNETELAALQVEYDNYRHLRRIASPVLVRTFGIFTFDANQDLYGLLMDHDGLRSWLLAAPRQEPYNTCNAKITQALDTLHGIGFTHGKLLQEHFVITKKGKVSIISLGSCKKILSVGFPEITNWQPKYAPAPRRRPVRTQSQTRSPDIGSDELITKRHQNKERKMLLGWVTGDLQDSDSPADRDLAPVLEEEEIMEVDNE